MKRISVILLSLCILCGSMPLSAGAEEVYQEPAFSDEELEDVVLEDQGGSQDLTDILIDEDLIFLEDDLPDWDLVPEELPEEMLLLTEELIEQEELLSAPDNWSLPLVNGGTLTNKTYADKVQLIYFLGDYSDHAYLKAVAKAKWAGNEKLKIIAVCDTDSKADALALSKSLTPGSSGITYAYDGSFLKWSIWSSFHPNTGVGDMGMIFKTGKLLKSGIFHMRPLQLSRSLVTLISDLPPFYGLCIPLIIRSLIRILSPAKYSFLYSFILTIRTYCILPASMKSPHLCGPEILHFRSLRLIQQIIRNPQKHIEIPIPRDQDLSFSHMMIMHWSAVSTANSA